jgi:hypothetical protein
MRQNTRTEDRPYPSRYAKDTWVTPAQYITELICEHKAVMDKKDLPYRFWTLPEWAKFFRGQINAANSLLKKHSVQAITQALHSDRGRRIYSLRAPWLEEIIVAEEKVIKAKAYKPEKPQSISVPVKGKRTHQNSKQIDKLLEYE